MRAVNLLPKEESRGRKSAPLPLLVGVGLALSSTVALSRRLPAGQRQGRRPPAASSTTARRGSTAMPEAGRPEPSTRRGRLTAEQQAARHRPRPGAVPPRRLGPPAARGLAGAARATSGSSTLSAKAPITRRRRRSPSPPRRPAPPRPASPSTAPPTRRTASPALLARIQVLPDLTNVQLQKSTLTKLGDRRRRVTFTSSPTSAHPEAPRDDDRQDRPRRRRRSSSRAIVAAALVVALGGWFVLVSPQKRAREEARRARSPTCSGRSRSARPPSRSQNARAARSRRADLFRLTKAMPDQTDMPDILLELSRVARETRDRVPVDLARTPALAERGYQVVPINLVFQGNFYDLADFVYRLRNLVGVHDGKLDRDRAPLLGRLDRLRRGRAEVPADPRHAAVDAYVYGRAWPARRDAAPPTGDRHDLDRPTTTTTTTTGTTTRARRRCRR